MRSDILVSVAVVDEAGPAHTVPRLAGLVEALSQAYRHFEVLYVVSETARGALAPLAGEIARLPNLRVIVTSQGTRFYRQRLIAVLEAIGDVVALLDLDELPAAALMARLAESHDRNQILIGERPARARHRWTYGLLSIVSSNIITAQAARTILLPRGLINGVTTRHSAALDLRFEPRVPYARYRRFDVPGRPGSRGDPGQRHELFLEILLCGAPRYLKAYAAAGVVVMAGASLYGLYAVGVLLFDRHVQEGWFSTAVTQAGSTAFISGGMSILAIGLLAIHERLHAGEDRIIVDEIANAGLFDGVTERNVEFTGGADPAPAPSEDGPAGEAERRRTPVSQTP